VTGGVRFRHAGSRQPSHLLLGFMASADRASDDESYRKTRATPARSAVTSGNYLTQANTPLIRTAGWPVCL